MEREVELAGDVAGELADMASLWGDLLHVRQALHDRSSVPNTPANLFHRRAIWEGAIIGYGRCFGTGRRSRFPQALLDDVEDRLLRRHRLTLGLRNQHVDHRAAPSLEKVEVTGVFPGRTAHLRSIRVRVATQIGPEEDVAAAELEELADLLKNRLWADVIAPLEQELLSLMRGEVAALSQRARRRRDADQGVDQLTITLNPST